MFEYICIIGGVVSFAGLHTVYRIAGRRKCRPEAANAAFMLWASLAAGMLALLIQQAGPVPEALRVRFYAVSVAMGSLVPVAVVFYMLALKHGKLAPSAMMISLSITIPIFGSILVYDEKLTPARVAAIALALCAVILLWVDKRREENADVV